MARILFGVFFFLPSIGFLSGPAAKESLTAAETMSKNMEDFRLFQLFCCNLFDDKSILTLRHPDVLDWLLPMTRI